VESTAVWPKESSTWRKIRSLIKKISGCFDVSRDPHHGLYTEKHFRALLHLEEARSARSGKASLLMLFNVASLEDRFVHEVARIVLAVPRESDVKGWWRSGVEIGILFTEIGAPSREAFIETERTIEGKIRKRLSSMVTDRIAISYRMFPGPPRQGSTHDGWEGRHD
jgi:hypothetical protein